MRQFIAAHERWPLALCVAAFLIYASLGFVGHLSLRTNAFDLSVFDYAIWSSSTGGPLGYVPMFRHSLFAQHFMPSLLVLTPLGAIVGSPTYLVVLQTLFYAAAGFVFFRFASRFVSPGLAVALLVAFLFSRRTHGAVTSYFYIESAEPLLIFASLLAWATGRRALFWVCAALAMGCKEDVPVYFFMFGLTQVLERSTRRFGLTLMAVSAAWVGFAVLVAVPYWRGVYGLTLGNPFLEARYGSLNDTYGSFAQLASLESLGRVFSIAGATVFLCLLAPRWAVIALPGLVLNLMAAPGTEQAGVTGHYLWPILPWLFVAAVFGARNIPTHWQRWLPAVIVVTTALSTPLVTSFARTPWTGLPAGREVRTQLAELPAHGVLLAQPNLIPHLPRRRDIHSLGVYEAGQPASDFVVMTHHGDLWPFTEAQIDALITRYQSDPSWEQAENGPLFVFRRR